MSSCVTESAFSVEADMTRPISLDVSTMRSARGLRSDCFESVASSGNEGAHLERSKTARHVVHRTSIAQQDRQSDGALDGLAGALALVRQRRRRSVADEHEAVAVVPGRKRSSKKERLAHEAPVLVMCAHDLDQVLHRLRTSVRAVRSAGQTLDQPSSSAANSSIEPVAVQLHDQLNPVEPTHLSFASVRSAVMNATTLSLSPPWPTGKVRKWRIGPRSVCPLICSVSSA